MNNNLTKILLLFLFVGGLASCDKNNDDGNDIDKTYKFVSIMWKFDNEDREDTLVIQSPEKIFYNYENTVKEIVIIPLENIKETSNFEIKNDQDLEFLRKWVSDSLFVPIPKNFNLLSSEYKRIPGFDKAPFMKEEVSLEPLSNVTRTFSLSPNSKLTHNEDIYMKRVTATFEASFESQFDNFVIQGKWTGMFWARKNESNTLIEDIEK